MVEDGVAEVDDILRDRIERFRLDRQRAQTALDRVRLQALPATEIPPEMIERCGQEMRENIAKWRSVRESNPYFSLERAGSFFSAGSHLFATI